MFNYGITYVMLSRRSVAAALDVKSTFACEL